MVMWIFHCSFSFLSNMSQILILSGHPLSFIHPLRILDVCMWLQLCYDQYTLDAKCISFSHFDINCSYARWPRNRLWMLQAFVENTCISSYRIAGYIHDYCSRNQTQNMKYCIFVWVQQKMWNPHSWALKKGEIQRPLRYYRRIIVEQFHCKQSQIAISLQVLASQLHTVQAHLWEPLKSPKGHKLCSLLWFFYSKWPTWMLQERFEFWQDIERHNTLLFL